MSIRKAKQTCRGGEEIEFIDSQTSTKKNSNFLLTSAMLISPELLVSRALNASRNLLPDVDNHDDYKEIKTIVKIKDDYFWRSSLLLSL